MLACVISRISSRLFQHIREIKGRHGNFWLSTIAALRSGSSIWITGIFVGIVYRSSSSSSMVIVVSIYRYISTEIASAARVCLLNNLRSDVIIVGHIGQIHCIINILLLLLLLKLSLLEQII